MPSKRKPRARRARRTGANRTKSKATKFRISHAGRTDNRQSVTRRQLPRQRSLAALAGVRRGKSLSQAASDEHTTTRTVLKYVRNELKQDSSGRYRPTDSDTQRRDLNVLGFDGYEPVVVRSSKRAHLASEHLIAVGRFLRTGDPGLLNPFGGKRVGRVELLTDPDRLQILADAGLVKLDALYRNNPGGGREK
jgi:hypothetical protein